MAYRSWRDDFYESQCREAYQAELLNDKAKQAAEKWIEQEYWDLDGGYVMSREMFFREYLFDEIDKIISLNLNAKYVLEIIKERWLEQLISHAKDCLLEM